MEEGKNQPLTPEKAIDYLQFKLVQEHKDFLSYRGELVPYPFSAEEFCGMINDFRRKIRKYNKKENE